VAEENENKNADKSVADGDEPIENRLLETEDSSPYDSAISNATKNLLTSICTVFGLFFDENYKNDYHVSLEKLMRLNKFEQKKRTVSRFR